MTGLGHGGGKGGATRLDGLLDLLDKGTNASVRRMAASQIGELIAAHPAETRPVLRRVRALLLSPSWDTRVAAGHALAAIASHSPRFTAGGAEEKKQEVKIEEIKNSEAPVVGDGVTAVEKSKREDEIHSAVSIDAGPAFDQNAKIEGGDAWATGLQLANLDIVRILESGALLFGSSGEQYEGVELDAQQQRARLKADLGLDDRIVGNSDMFSIADADLAASNAPVPETAAVSGAGVSVDDIVDDMASKNLSARERNRLKREAKKRSRLNVSGAGDPMGMDAKRQRTANGSAAGGARTGGQPGTEPGPGLDEDGSFADGQDDYETQYGPQFCDFQPTCEVLKNALLHARWEARHGATVGIRHILSVHAESLGRRSRNLHTADAENARWLEDIVCRLLCVLVMDRFGDFVGDAVVAPVRETAAMAMAAASRVMDKTVVLSLVSLLLGLLSSETAKRQWEIRHAVLLAVRYVLAVRSSLGDATDLIGVAFNPVAGSLRDLDDDVRAVAAESLQPIASAVVAIIPEKIPGLVAALWDALLDLDDISASTGSVMRLLTELLRISPPPGAPPLWLVASAFEDEDGDANETEPFADDGGCPSFSRQPLVHLVPRVWPFMRHGSVTVRRAAIALLEKLAPSSSQSRDHDFTWLRALCGEALERLFRNLLLETDSQVLQTTKRVWSSVLLLLAAQESDVAIATESASPLLSHWLEACAHETRTEAAAFDQARYSKGPKETRARRRRSAAAARRAAKARAGAGGIVGSSIFGVSQDVDSSVPAVEGPYEGVFMQHNVADALGRLAAMWPLSDPRFEAQIVKMLQNPFATARRVACDVSRMWAMHGGPPAGPTSNVYGALTSEMDGTSSCQYAEVGVVAGSFFSDSISLLDAVGHAFGGAVDVHRLRGNCENGKVSLARNDYAAAALVARSLHPFVQDAVVAKWTLWVTYSQSQNTSNAQAELIFALRQRILTSLGYMSERNEELAVSLAASASSALVAIEAVDLPQKVGPLIKALTASSRKSRNPNVQQVAANGLAVLSKRLAARGTVKPLQLLLKNLTKHLTAEPTKDDAKNGHLDGAVEGESGRAPDRVSGRGRGRGGSRGRGRRRYVEDAAEATVDKMDCAENLETLDPVEIARRGASLTLCAFCDCFGGDLFDKLPWVWNVVKLGCAHGSGERPHAERVDGLSILRTIIGPISPSLHGQVANLVPNVIHCCADADAKISDLAVSCLADVVAAVPGPGMCDIVRRLVPMLSGSPSSGGDSSETAKYARRGASKALRAVVDRLGSALIPYAAFLIVPVMMRMVDADLVVRNASSGIFGVLVRLMPLEGGAPDDPDMSTSMSSEREEARIFLGQLLGTHPRTHYEMPVQIGDGVTLRKYQQECLDWLAFLNRYGLHGALCDDMGLGKTLMTLCIMAGDRVQLMRKISSNANGDSVGAEAIASPSLVVCPSTIAAHWVQEAQRFFGGTLDPVVLYIGPPRTRARIRGDTPFPNAALVVTSYEILSNDLDHFKTLQWNYVALDEGHVVKNPKTRVARAVRAVSALHRLVLTGTPIQNSVLELWSLFDFLMPGFLGSELSFKETYAKPILASRGDQCTEASRERGIVATEALHRQVLPFVLRRLKDDVLSELPPKIMQDYYCRMTPLQVELYEDFSRDVAQNGVESIVDGEGEDGDGKSSSSGGSHVFKVLSYLRRLCSHPKLVLSESHPEYQRVMQDLAAKGQSIDDISSSAKMIGLRNILEECGIGDVSALGGRETGGHRVLIFAQLKQMLDLVESDLFRAHMPTVTYLRLDGSVATSKRQAIVTRFNADPTIDCLLLTTSVGGLGLNLVGADTVVFLEHSWNPTQDLQAMDRAHRMGQKRTVNVYRLITRGTLEEKIMGIQKFKTQIANTVVNRENSSLQSMNTETLLSLFKVDGDDADDSDGRNKAVQSGEGKGMKAALAGLGELWEESQYEDAHNMDDFLAGMQPLAGVPLLDANKPSA